MSIGCREGVTRPARIGAGAAFLASAAAIFPISGTAAFVASGAATRFAAVTFTATATLLAARAAHASPEEPTATLPPLVVTAPVDDAALLELPASLDVLDVSRIRSAGPGASLAESLATVPGVMARDRLNQAQDIQISMRGFGARASFGIRGLRLYVDDIPATLPDGQGQLSHVDPALVERIEVLRGPFSALYGNASGGVMRLFTDDGSGPATLVSELAGGGRGLLRARLGASGGGAGFGYAANLSHLQTDGWRPHSAAQREIANLKLRWAPDDTQRLTLVVNRLWQPLAQDPLGLTRAQFEADARQTDANALRFDTRKTVAQLQAGAVYERKLAAAQSLRLAVYAGSRDTQQFQAIPVAAQANPLHAGGVIDLRRDYAGMDLRWLLDAELRGAPLQLAAGLSYDSLAEDRLGYENFIGQALGVRGALRRDERNRAANLDPYLQLAWRPAPRWTLQAGVRHTRVRFASDDRYRNGLNGDDSSGARYGATLPMAGLQYAASRQWQLYLSAGRGFETPTLNELSYRPDGQPGLNFELRPAVSRSVEAGMRWRSGGGVQANLALFRTDARDEIAVFGNSGGRATFHNAGGSRRDGVELSLSVPLSMRWRMNAALSWLDARYRGGGCAAGGTGAIAGTGGTCLAGAAPIEAGRRIPGVAGTMGFAELAWRAPQGWQAAFDLRGVGRVWADDRNSQAAGGYLVAGLSAGYRARLQSWQVDAFARIDNLFDRRHVGSLIVNEGNGRFYEPGAGRQWSLGVRASRGFW